MHISVLVFLLDNLVNMRVKLHLNIQAPLPLDPA